MFEEVTKECNGVVHATRDGPIYKNGKRDTMNTKLYLKI